MADRTIGICCTCIGAFLMIMAAALMALGVKLLIERDEQVSHTQSKFLKGTKTPVYYEYFLFSVVSGIISCVTCVCGWTSFADYEKKLIKRLRRRYQRERPQRLAEGDLEMRHIYLRRSPTPPEANERLM